MCPETDGMQTHVRYNEGRVPTVASRSGTTNMEENGASRAVPRRDQIEASMLGVHRANCLVIAVKSPVGLSRVDRARHRVRLCPLTMSNHLVDLLIYTLGVVPIWLEPSGFRRRCATGPLRPPRLSARSWLPVREGARRFAALVSDFSPDISPRSPGIPLPGLRFLSSERPRPR